MGIKWMSILLLQITMAVIGNGGSENGSSSKQNFLRMKRNDAVKTIESEDGDVIDCIDIYKQPAFDHPSLRNHKIQMRPTYDPTLMMKTTETETMKAPKQGKEDSQFAVTTQLWQKSGTCPEGTIPVRRMPDKSESKAIPARKKPSSFTYHDKQFMDNKQLKLLQENRSLAVLHTEGYAYFGAKGDIKVWNPSVEGDDEYTTSQVALKIGPRLQYEAIESGWAVNPSVYGDRKTRLFVYWTIDSSVKTGCFDLTCPGFVQTNKDVALGAAIYPISNPTGLPSQITIFILKDPNTSNWWVNYGEKINIGYWPGELFNMLYYHAETVQWGGEVYSSRVGIHPNHTATGMGSGDYADWGIFSNSGYIKRIRVVLNSLIMKFPDWVSSYADEYDCYDTLYHSEYVQDPEFYYGGPGRNYKCT